MSKVGLVVPYWSSVTKAELIETARLAEELGYDSLWVPEMWGRDAFSILGFLAVNTDKIKLGTGVISVFSRTPAAIAQTVATLDEISEGRVILGLGTSSPVLAQDWHGAKFEKTLERTREYVEIIRMILSEKRVNYDGGLFRLKNFRLQFTPARRDIPIYIASLSPKNLRLTGMIADGWIPYLVPGEYIRDAKKEIASGAETTGKDAERITACPYIPACVSEDAELSKSMTREHIAYYIGGMGTFYHKTMSRYGFQDEANRIREAWNTGDKTQAALSVSDKMLDSVAVSGTGKEGKRKLDEYARAGADLPILMLPAKCPPEMIRETITELAP